MVDFLKRYEVLSLDIFKFSLKLGYLKEFKEEGKNYLNNR